MLLRPYSLCSKWIPWHLLQGSYHKWKCLEYHTGHCLQEKPDHIWGGGKKKKNKKIKMVWPHNKYWWALQDNSSWSRAREKKTNVTVKEVDGQHPEVGQRGVLLKLGPYSTSSRNLVSWGCIQQYSTFMAMAGYQDQGQKQKSLSQSQLLLLSKFYAMHLKLIFLL